MDGVGWEGFGKGNGNHVVIKYCNVEGLGYVVGDHNCSFMIPGCLYMICLFIGLFCKIDVK